MPLSVTSLDLNFAAVVILAIVTVFALSALTTLSVVVARRPEIALKLILAIVQVLIAITNVLRPRE